MLRTDTGLAVIGEEMTNPSQEKSLGNAGECAGANGATDFVSRFQHLADLSRVNLERLDFLGLHGTSAQGVLALLQTGALPTTNSQGRLYFYADPSQVRAGHLPPHPEEPNPPIDVAHAISLTASYAQTCARGYGFLSLLGLPLSMRLSVGLDHPCHEFDWTSRNTDVVSLIRAGTSYADYARAYNLIDGSDYSGFIVALSPNVLKEFKVFTASELAGTPDEGYALVAPAGISLQHILGVRAEGKFEKMILDRIQQGEDIIAPITNGSSRAQKAVTS